MYLQSSTYTYTNGHLSNSVGTAAPLEQLSLVAGVDGCPGGWVVVVAASNGSRFDLRAVEVVPSFVALLKLTSECAAVAVDIPIGLSERGPRLADLAARRLLGRPRASSVFPTPLRAALPCIAYRQACAASVAAGGKMLSQQAFNILPKIREADAALSPADQSRLVESHPELTFAMINSGRPLAHNKKTPAGRVERGRLLSALYDIDITRLARPRTCGVDDLYDACALVWTASRLTHGLETHLPSAPQRDARGFRMEIVY
jgi:predicted RNase H-like nuclease